jgi:peptide/nickel transport system permease protein
MSVDRLALARQALAHGDSDSARKLVAQVLMADPSNEQAWLLMARLANNRNQVIDCLEHALRLNPSNRSTISALSVIKRSQPPPSLTVAAPITTSPAVARRQALRPPGAEIKIEAAIPVIPALHETTAETFKTPKRKRNLALLIGSLIVFIVVMIAIIGPRIAPQDPMEEHAILQAGGKWYIPPFNAFQVPGFILGSDSFGRDMLSRILYAVRPTLIMVSIVAVVRLFIGTLFGLGAGWSTGRLGRLLDGLISAALALPVLLIALGAITVLGTETGIVAFIVGLSINGWGETARLVRQQTELIKGQLFIESARSQGASVFQILYRHILRQIMPMVLMLFAFEIGGTLMVTGGLGFLGYYIGGDVWIEVADFVSRRTSGSPELGQMLATSWVNLLQPWPLVLTGSVVFLTILGFNLLGEGLRTRLDPVYINRASLFSRISRRIGVIFEEYISYPATQWLKANRLRPVMVGALVLFISGSLYLYQTRIANRFNPSLANLSIPGGQIWAADRIDPWGTAYFNSIGPAEAKLLWQMNDFTGLSGTPVVSSTGTIYVAGLDSKLIALNPDGTIRWQVDTPEVPLGSLALGRDGTIYVPSTKGGLSAFSTDGVFLWAFATDAAGKPTHGAIVAPTGNIYYLLETPIGDTLIALSPSGQLVWSMKPGTYGANTGLRLSPDEKQLFVKDVVVNITDGSIDELALPTQDNPVLGNQPHLFTGADGKKYLLAGHAVIQWKQDSQTFTIVNSMNWDYRSHGMNQSSGFPLDGGVLPQGNMWLFYSGYYGYTGIFWLNPKGDVLGQAAGLLNQSTRLVAVDGNSTAYVCGIGFSTDQGQNSILCEAYKPDAVAPIWSYLFPEGTNGIVGAAMAPGRLYVVTQDGTLSALGETALPAPTASATP